MAEKNLIPHKAIVELRSGEGAEDFAWLTGLLFNEHSPKQARLIFSRPHPDILAEEYLVN